MKVKLKKKSVALLLLGGCVVAALAMALWKQTDAAKGTQEEESRFASHTEGNGIYYWKTHFKLTDEDREFLKKHEVKRLYLRFFDVDFDPGYSELAVPIATATFDSTACRLPAELIPTVYITVDALWGMKGKEREFADRIVTRVLAMAKGNRLPEVKEVQLDCDWTKTSQSIFFALCEEIRELLHQKEIALSSTIRLHQLRTETPPVDRGVLMLYNTGSIKRAETKNSILNKKDIAPYLKNADYKLHLDFAYPTFAWGIWFRGEDFKAILRNTDYSDTTLYKRQENGMFEVQQEHRLGRHKLQEGDLIRLEESDYEQIMQVKKLVNHAFPREGSSILYHLDMNNLNKYSDNEVKSMYGTH